MRLTKTISMWGMLPNPTLTANMFSKLPNPTLFVKKMMYADFHDDGWNVKTINGNIFYAIFEPLSFKTIYDP